LIRHLPVVAVLAYAATALGFGEKEVADELARYAQYDDARLIRLADTEDRQAPGQSLTVATLIEPRFATESTTSAKTESDRIISLLAKKEFDKALELARKLIETNPNDPNGYNLQGTAYAGKNDLANARKSFEKALGLQPDYVQALFNLAQLDIQQKDLASARKRYQAILAKDAKNALAMIGMADVEAADKKDQESLAWLKKAKSANPESTTPRLALGTYYLRNKNNGMALSELTEALRSHPDDAGLLGLLGQVQLANRQAAVAVATYKKLVSVRPELPAAHYHLAIAQVDNQDFSAAAESLRKAVQLKPDYVEAIDALAKLEIRAGRPAEALKLAKDLQKAAPRSPAGLTLEGDLLLQQKRYADALKAYQGAFALGQSSLLAVKLHVAQNKAGNRKEADAKLQQWLNDHPDDVGAWQYLAGQNLKAGNNKLAIEQYQRVLQKAPDNAMALSDLAILYQREKDPRALTIADRAYQLVPDSATTADTLGWILLEQGKTARGLELIQKAAAQAPRNAQIRYHLAVALAKSGDKGKARKELESLLAGDREFPQREAAQLMLKQL
jgi:putative PEP-CTERM system TPR-repeat lipoprotein